MPPPAGIEVDCHLFGRAQMLRDVVGCDPGLGRFARRTWHGSLFPKVPSQLDSELNVPGLARLIASGQWKQQARPALRAIGAVARANVDPEFRDAASQVTVLTSVSSDQSLASDEDPGLV